MLVSEMTTTTLQDHPDLSARRNVGVFLISALALQVLSRATWEKEEAKRRRWKKRNRYKTDEAPSRILLADPSFSTRKILTRWWRSKDNFLSNITGVL